MSPKVRVYLAWGLLLVSLILWPVSMLTFAKTEPPWVLSLSWFAIITTCLDIVSTQDVRKKQEDAGEDGDAGVG